MRKLILVIYSFCILLVVITLFPVQVQAANGPLLYLTNAISNNIGVLNTGTNTLQTSIPIGVQRSPDHKYYHPMDQNCMLLILMIPLFQ